ncbi:MgtC/SapB family protein [Paenibacillus sp. 1P07SE]|uniref:MgtC/SapB family protein n=1 Tax=Paenibacillus sp. 1P07SE TaxID=3132209 RepID=UPI0039A4EE8E
MELVADSPWYISEYEILIRLLIAVLLGGLIGFEREHSNHPAGLRTNILVCLGSCLLMLLSIYGFSEFVNEGNVRLDPARLAAQVITGIGFLGAGTILFTGKAITGLTTAATLWVVSAIGLAVGAGFVYASIFSTVMVLIILWALNKMEKRFLRGKQEHLLVIRAAEQGVIMETVTTLLTKRNIMIRKASIVDHADKELLMPDYMLHLKITLPSGESPWMLVDEIKRLDGIRAVSLD